MDDIPRFIGDLLWNLWTVSIGVVLGIEPVMRWAWPGYDAFAANYLTADHRKKLTHGLAVLAFLMANYLAYHGAKNETRAALNRTAPAEELNEARWPPLTDDEKLSLRLSLKDAPIPKFDRIICSDSDCRKLADGLVAVFRGLNWPVKPEYGPHYDTPTGIVIFQKDKADHALADAIERASGGKLLIDVQSADDPASFALVIGTRP